MGVLDSFLAWGWGFAHQKSCPVRGGWSGLELTDTPPFHGYHNTVSKLSKNFVVMPLF